MRLFTAILLIFSLSSAASFGRIRGIVTDSFGKPVADASVSIAGRNTRTGVDGKYEFACVKSCRTGMIITGSNFKKYQEVFSVYQGDNFFTHELQPVHEIRVKKEIPESFDEISQQPVFEEVEKKPVLPVRQSAGNNYWSDNGMKKHSDEIAQLIEESSSETEVEGIVVSEQTGIPLANAVIAIGNQKEISGSDGKYHFASVEKGKHIIVVSCHEYETKQTEYTFSEKCVLDFLLTAKE